MAPVQSSLRQPKVATWSSKSKDGLFLKLLVETGAVDGMTATEVKYNFRQFEKYETKTMASALSNANKSFSNSLKTRGSPNSKLIVS